jgi:folylpolyglutamate synthase/dihydropteroate synthase
MLFEQAMTLVECDHEFPSDLRDFHNRRTQKLFEDTGLTEALKSIPLVVVTGSCGKASTARYLAECVSELFALTGGAKPVGLGTKPPLLETLDGNRERYQLLREGTGRWIEPEEFAELVSFLPALEKNLAPYDLRYWLLGRMFVEHGVGLGIVEANIGFRLDPAALFPSPVAQLLTPIGFDHVGMLTPEGAPESVLALGQRAGPTWHKACALDPNRLVVCGLQPREVEAVVKAYQPDLILAGRDYSCEVVEETLRATKARLHMGQECIDVHLQTLGRHQAENASQAAACLWALWERGVFRGEKEQVRDAISIGLARTKIPGRMERLDHDTPVVLNAATGIIKIEGMMTTVEDVLDEGQTIWVCMSVLERLVRSGIPDWLDVCLRRILGSPKVVGFTATAFSEDLDPNVLADWARARCRSTTVDHHRDPYENLDRVTGLADLVLLVGQSQAQLRSYPG